MSPPAKHDAGTMPNHVPACGRVAPSTLRMTQHHPLPLPRRSRGSSPNTCWTVNVAACPPGYPPPFLLDHYCCRSTPCTHHLTRHLFRSYNPASLYVDSPSNRHVFPRIRACHVLVCPRYDAYEACMVFVATHCEHYLIKRLLNKHRSSTRMVSLAHSVGAHP